MYGYSNNVNDYQRRQLNLLLPNPQGYSQWPVSVVPTSPETSPVSSGVFPRAILGRSTTNSSAASSPTSWSQSSSGSTSSATSFFPLNPSLEEDILERLRLISKYDSQRRSGHGKLFKNLLHKLLNNNLSAHNKFVCIKD